VTLAELEHWAHVGNVEPREPAAFATQAPVGCQILISPGEHRDGDEARLRMPGAVYDTHSAAADLLLQKEPPELLRMRHACPPFDWRTVWCLVGG